MIPRSVDETDSPLSAASAAAMPPAPGNVFREYALDVLFQFKVLFIKNLRMLYRGWRSTLLVLSPPVFAVLLLFMMQFLPSSLSNTHPDPNLILPITGCQGRTSDDTKCYPLVYASDVAFQTLADTFMQTLAADSKLKVSDSLDHYGDIIRFPDYDSMHAWMKDDSSFNHTYGAVYFNNNAPVNQSAYLKLIVYYNSTCENFLFPCETMRYSVDLSFVSAYLRVFMDHPSLVPALRLSYSEFPVLAPSNTSVRDYGSLFFYFASSFFFVVLVYEVVTEKERKLRLGMQTMGLRNSVYYLTWFVHSQILLVVQVLLLIAAGAAFQIPYFLYTNFFANFLIFWTFGFCMNSVSFVLAAILPSSRIATYVSLGLSMVGLLIVTVFSGALGALFFALTNSSDVPIGLIIAGWVLRMFPMYNLTKAMFDVNSMSYESDGIKGPGYGFSDLFNTRQLQFGTSTPTYESLIANVILAVVFSIVAIYFDHIIPGNSGSSQSLWYPLSPHYWGLMRPRPRPNKHLLNFERDADEIGVPMDSDVRDEYARSANPQNDDPVRIMGVRKVYKRFPLISSSKDNKACKNFSASIGQGSLLCLLGHNGAGKSTTFNILTGLFPPSEGDGMVFGNSVVGAMSAIRRTMGVCPQHDILWDELTAREHLEIFADLKRFYPWPWQRAARRAALDEYVEAVKLTAVQHHYVSTYSGGMKRRLSVAIALIGDPRVVFLDEPTTGMDPLSRRHVWNLIQSEKKRRVIVLTTHLMEEADILGDRIAVMSRGLIRAIGTSIRLKNKYGNGYRINVSAEPTAVDEAMRVITAEVDGAELVGRTNQFLMYGLRTANSGAVLVGFFRRLEAGAYRGVIASASVSGPTLEEVFINVTSQFEDNVRELHQNQTVAAAE